MRSEAAEDLTKLQVVCSLFAKTICGDLYFARQIKESIEASLPDSRPASPESFIQRASELVDKLEREPDDIGVELVPAETSNAPFSMLDFRVNLLEAMKRICRFESGLVVLTGLKQAICPQGRRWSPRRKRDYEEAIRFARDFCRRRSRPSSRLSLIIF